MKIILVVTGAKGKNVIFVDEALKAHSLQEAVRLAQTGTFENVHTVQKDGDVYLRLSRTVPKKEQLEQVAISARQLFNFVEIRHAVSTPSIAHYLQLYEHSLQEDGGPFIVIEGKVRVTKGETKTKLIAHKDYVFVAAKRFSIDPYLLGAIIIDEIARFAPFENITDTLAGYFVGIDTSAGIAQVKTLTARGLIRDGYYNPNPNDKKLSPEHIQNTSLSYVYTYVKEPKHSIFFAAARMRELTDKWKKFVDLTTRPEIIATLYHLPSRQPHDKPEANPRGVQIAGEFFELATVWLQ